MPDYYDKWNEVKKDLNNREGGLLTFKNRDVLWISVGRNIGQEVYGKGTNFTRPVLVVRKFNREFFIGVPLTTKLKKGPYYIEISVKGRRVCALSTQIRSFSSKRILRKLVRIRSNDYKKVLDGLSYILRFPRPK